MTNDDTTNKMREALVAFCEVIENDLRGLPLLGPAFTHPEYHELDEPYLRACEALGRPPKGACDCCHGEQRNRANATSS